MERRRLDLPVLHYRGLIAWGQRSALLIWAMAIFADSRDFKWNNYISRYHMRHLDLMDLLALYQPRANAPLDDLARLIGFPGKLGMDGGQVWAAWCAGELAGIRDYCETDVMNTYLVYQPLPPDARGTVARCVCCRDRVCPE